MIKCMLLAKLRQSRGMTLVELMVSIAITAVIMGFSLSFFITQYKSYRHRHVMLEHTQTAPAVLELLKRELMQSGWGVHQQMAFYIQDGGDSDHDRIFINDTSLIGANEVGRFVGNDCPGCAEIEKLDGQNINDNKEEIYGKEVKVSTLYISKILEGEEHQGEGEEHQGEGEEHQGEGEEHQEEEDNSKKRKPDFRQNISMYVITDSESVNKIAKINSLNIDQRTLTLNKEVGGNFITPVIRYACEKTDDKLNLKRNDRHTSGLQPMMENVVDLQVAYSTDSGETWFCDGGDENDEGSNGCPEEKVTVKATSKGDLSPEEINLLRVTLVTRSGLWDVSRIHDPNYCRPAVENRAGAALGSDECGYHYRTHTRVIRPRNFGRH